MSDIQTLRKCLSTLDWWIVIGGCPEGDRLMETILQRSYSTPEASADTMTFTFDGFRVLACHKRWMMNFAATGDILYAKDTPAAILARMGEIMEGITFEGGDEPRPVARPVINGVQAG